MNLRLYSLRFIFVFGLVFANSSYSNTYTYEFTQDWSSNDSTALFGTGIKIDITFDNGANTNTNQAYLWSDIVSITGSTIGGSFTPYTMSYNNSQVYWDTVLLTTNATGNAGIYDGNSNYPDAVIGTQTIGAIDEHYQIGSGSWVNLWVEDINHSTNNILSASYQAPADIIENAILINPIPEPSIFWLFGAGVLGLKRRQR